MVLPRSVQVLLIVLATYAVVRLLLAAVALFAVTALIRSLAGDTAGASLCAAAISYVAAIAAIYLGGRFAWRTIAG
jgi:hypothetical protein